MSDRGTLTSKFCEAKHPNPDLDVPGCVLYRGHVGSHQGFLMPEFTRITWPGDAESRPAGETNPLLFDYHSPEDS